jgi:hypothetical protein
LWEAIDPVVVTPIATAAAAAAANITDTMSQKSQNSPFRPRNRVEAAAFALSIVSVIGEALSAALGIFALREFRGKPWPNLNTTCLSSSAAIHVRKNIGVKRTVHSVDNSG